MGSEKGLEITLAKASSESKMETVSNIGNESAANMDDYNDSWNIKTINEKSAARNLDYSHTSLKEKRQQIPPSKEVPAGYEEINGILYLVKHAKVINSCNSDEAK